MVHFLPELTSGRTGTLRTGRLEDGGLNRAWLQATKAATNSFEKLNRRSRDDIRYSIKFNHDESFLFT